MIGYDKKGPITEEMAKNRILLLSSDDELISLISHKGIEEYLGEHIERFGKTNYHMTSQSGRILDTCTSYFSIESHLSGIDGFIPYVFERDTAEFKSNRTFYQRINDFLYSMIGLNIHGTMVFNNDPKSWMLPKNVFYTGLIDGFDGEDVYPNLDLHIEIESLLDRLSIDHKKIPFSENDA